MLLMTSPQLLSHTVADLQARIASREKIKGSEEFQTRGELPLVFKEALRPASRLMIIPF
jgi:hypothetical protein